MECPVERRFHDVTSALVYSFAAAHADSNQPALQPPYNDVTAFVLRQHARLPDYLRLPLLVATLAFDLGGFHRRHPQARAKRVAAWKNSSFAFAQDLMRYHETLTTFALYSRTDPAIALPPSGDFEPQGGELRCEVLVVGSGPAGSITACVLAEAGRDVLLLEEGDFYAPDSCAPFSQAEMEQKYRHGGQTVAFGRPKISYVEGCCVGGGSEINSGLYHRPSPELLEQWRRQFDVQHLTDTDLRVHCETIEKVISVSLLSNSPPPASLRLQRGAEQLGWKCVEVPRWFVGEARQSMTRTFLARYLQAGGKLVSGSRALRLWRGTGGGWLLQAQHPSGRLRIHAARVFLCAGAVQTPYLLLRSGFGGMVGRTLQVHPTVKIAARFAEPVNYPGMGVPVHQVKEFAPLLSFGCSISTPAHLALALLDHPQYQSEVRRNWTHMANYYAMITPEGSGTVGTVPGFDSPLVRYRLTERDLKNLADGLDKLEMLLRAAGAVAIYRNPNPMTIHLFSSCRMGERKDVCAVDSFGRVHGVENLYVNDASLLCTAPGVNPQGAIMALAHRNVIHFLQQKR